MKKKSIYFFLFLVSHFYYTYAQQISTDNTQPPNILIQNLVGTDCATASNVSSVINGNINSIISYGSFNSATSNFPLQSGLVLSTGRVTSAGNTLITEDLNEGNIAWTTDPDIEAILGIDQTLNATSIEFDFTTVNNFVSFNYLFASDEYQQEYPCIFKDVFAILVKRAGTTDPYINIALIPDSPTEISTNTIHPNITGFCEAQNEDYFRGYNLGATNFNGSTKVLNARADIIPNETYHIKLVIADHIDQRFDSAVFIEAEGFGNSIDLGPDQSICGSDLTLNANINNPLAAYTWSVNGTVIAGENNPTLEVIQSGTYGVEVSIPSASNSCTLSDTIVLEIIPFQEAEPIEDWSVCESQPSDGIYDFDFTRKNDEIYANLPSTNYIISYHNTLDEAQNNTNAITGIYQNTEQTETFFVRIESLSGDCLQIGSFNIIINAEPKTAEVTIFACGEVIYSNDFLIYNLSSLNYPVSDYEFNTTVTYYLTEDDATNSENALTDFPINEPPLFFAHVEDDFNGCAAIVPINISYIIPPDIGIDRYVVDGCFDIEGDLDYNSAVVSYNLEDIIAEIEAEYPEIYVQIIALIPGNPRIITTNSPSFQLPLLIRFHNENCPTPIRLEVHKNLTYNIIGDTNNIYRCDDSSNDGIVDFDLFEIAEELKGDYDLNFQFYETEEDRLNGSNAIDQSNLFTATDSRVVYINSTYNGCSQYSEVVLKIHPAINVPAKTVDYCGNTNPYTNNTNIVLEPLVDIVMEGLGIAGSVEFYLSADDAENQNNRLIESYDISGNQQLFFVRVLNFFTGCYDVSTLEVNINSVIDAGNPDPLIICDDDQDTITTVNLENVLPQLSDGSDDLTFTFFESYNHAVDNEFAIDNPQNYTTATTTIYIRAEIVAFQCFTIFPYEIEVYSNPQLTTISDFVNCELNPNAPSEFLFINKDINIIDGQPNMQVLYFETEDNAINRIDPIDKNAPYSPTSNPQTIFVRLENEAGNSCFKVAPMQIEARQAPIYNLPTDIFECDIYNNGLATTDLNQKIAQLSAGSSTNLNITFHLSPLNAEVGANQIPLNYTATSNPQIIYTRIENTSSGCVDIAAFSINTLSLPEVIYGQSLTKCGDNFNFSQEWNLTQIELEVLEGRQYNIEFIYFESEADLYADNNPIANPEAYVNTSNPQTVFAKVRNATTNCFDAVPFDLIIDSPPLINEFDTYSICENTENVVDLSEINSILLNNTFNVVVNYYANEADAEVEENPLNLEYAYTNSSETLFARVEYSTTRCYTVYPFQLIINPLPIANQPNNLIVCDDDFDGFVAFDLTQQNSTLLGNQNPIDFSISYYNSEENAMSGTEPLSTNYVAYDGETIFVRLENNISHCYAITQFSTVINELPFASIEDQYICLNELPLVVSAETNNPTDTYFWSTNAISSEIEIYETGTYSVTITNNLGCQNTSTFNVSESQSANIEVVETIDFSDPNNITVTVAGIGNYLYQLNTGSLQSSNVFQNVPIGYNTITVIDQNGCAQVTHEVLVIDTPKHLTPNDDGNFDTWHITGAETLPGTVISIFTRYGKLIKQLKHNDAGWDGTYNGNNMPSDDYWFVAEVIQNEHQFQIKGHFTLKR